MMYRINTWVIALIFSLFSLSVQIPALETVPFASEAAYAEYALLDEPLTTEQLTDLFLIASGLRQDRLDGYRSRINAVLRESEPVDGAEELLHFMHERLLKRYYTVQTRLDVLLDRGDYNCVSSAVLYMILTRYHDVHVQGIQTRDHAFCIIPGGDRGLGIDVETTSEWGFNPGEKKEFSSSFADRTGFVYVPPGNYRERQLMGDRDMAGLILQNRIVELQRRNLHVDALTLGADRFVLTGSEQARKDYYDTIQNAAAYYNGQRRYDDASELLDKAESGLGTLPDFLFDTRSQILYNAAADALNRNDIASAESILEDRFDSFSGDERALLEQQIRIRSLEIRAKESFSYDLISEIGRAADEGILTENRAASLAAFHFSREAERLTRDKEYRRAYEFLIDVPSWLSRDREYRRILAMVEENWAIDYHNRIVSLINQHDKEGARRLLEEALRNLPDSRILKDDKRRLGF